MFSLGHVGAARLEGRCTYVGFDGSEELRLRPCSGRRENRCKGCHGEYQAVGCVSFPRLMAVDVLLNSQVVLVTVIARQMSWRRTNDAVAHTCPRLYTISPFKFSKIGALLVATGRRQGGPT